MSFRCPSVNFRPCALPLRTARLAWAVAVALLLAAGAAHGEVITTPSVEILLQFSGVGQHPLLDGDEEKPSDAHLAVGRGSGAAGRLVQVTNNGIQLFDKSGRPLAGPMALEAFSGAPPNACYDPKALFDPASGRFFIVMAAGRSSRESRLHVAVSKTGVPQSLDAADWFFFSDTALATLPPAPGPRRAWFDYPTPACSARWLVVTGNLSDDNGASRGSKIRVFDKTELLAGRSRFVDFDLFRQQPGDGTFGVQPVQRLDPPPAPAAIPTPPDTATSAPLNANALWLISRAGPQEFRLWHLRAQAEDSATSAVLAGGGRHRWEAGAQVRDGAPQGPGAPVRIEVSSGRIMNAVERQGRIWCALTADGLGTGRAQVGWFQIDPGAGTSASATIATTATVVESGWISGEAGRWAFLPALSVDRAGGALVCFSEEGRGPSIRAAARPPSPPGAPFGPSVLIKESVGDYDDLDRHDPEKWGDYGACVADPDENGTFWITHQYCSKARSQGDDADWSSWIAQVRPVGAFSARPRTRAYKHRP